MVAKPGLGGCAVARVTQKGNTRERIRGKRPRGNEPAGICQLYPRFSCRWCWITYHLRRAIAAPCRVPKPPHSQGRHWGRQGRRALRNGTHPPIHPSSLKVVNCILRRSAATTRPPGASSWTAGGGGIIAARQKLGSDKSRFANYVKTCSGCTTSCRNLPRTPTLLFVNLNGEV